MIATLRERPAGLLTRHFFRALFDFGVFTQEGADAFVRVLIGLVALFISLGLFLARMYASKYAMLSAAATAAPYAHAMLADLTLAIAMPMWVVAFVAVLVGHSLFPDETDFRVLIPLPIDRTLVFGTKLLALALFAGLFTGATLVAMTPLALRILLGRWALDSAALGMAAFWIAGTGACAFAVLAIAAINGLLIVCTPKSRVHAWTAAVRSTMLAALVLALPGIVALPAQDLRFAERSTALLLAPPAWFLGVHRVLLGRHDPYFVRLAAIAAVAFVSALAIASATYVFLYRRFDRVMLRAFDAPARRGTRRQRAGETPARAAVRDFTTATLRRSALHQGVIVGLSACGIALAMNSVVRGGVVTWVLGTRSSWRPVFESVAWIPLPLIVILGMAVRASLALPIEPKANWIFRMTECDTIRVDELRAAERLMTRLVVIVPTALTFPLQWLVAGPRALAAAALTAAFGLLYVEVLLRDWRRIPFTCSYLPGKHSVAQSSLVGASTFWLVGVVGGAMEMGSLRTASPKPTFVIVALLLLLVAALRRQRRLTWRDTPLLFDDELPSDVQPFKLSSE